MQSTSRQSSAIRPAHLGRMRKADPRRVHSDSAVVCRVVIRQVAARIRRATALLGVVTTPLREGVRLIRKRGSPQSRCLDDSWGAV